MFAIKALVSAAALAAHVEGNSLEALSLIQQMAAKKHPKKSPKDVSEIASEMELANVSELLATAPSQAPAAKALPKTKVAPKALPEVAQVLEEGDRAEANPSDEAQVTPKSVKEKKQKPAASKGADSQIKELEKNRTQFNKKAQASYDKLLKNQDKQNKDLNKSNDKSAKDWGKLHKTNDMMQLKLSHLNEVNLELLENMKERKANLTAALAFTLTSEEDYKKSMQNSSILAVLDEIKAKPVDPAARVAEAAHPKNAAKKNKTKNGLLQEGVEGFSVADSGEGIVGQLSSLVDAVAREQSELESTMKVAFEEKFNAGEEIQRFLLAQQLQWNVTKADELARKDRLTAALQHVTEVYTKLDKELKSLSSFAKGTKTQPMQANLLNHVVDQEKYDSIAEHTQSLLNPKQGLFAMFR